LVRRIEAIAASLAQSREVWLAVVALELQFAAAPAGAAAAAFRRPIGIGIFWLVQISSAWSEAIGAVANQSQAPRGPGPALMRGGKVDIIANEVGNWITPSIVTFHQDQRLVGDSAVPQPIANPRNTVFAVKRLIGRRFADPGVRGGSNRFRTK
jgi:hypothetical protein